LIGRLVIGGFLIAFFFRKHLELMFEELDYGQPAKSSLLFFLVFCFILNEADAFNYFCLLPLERTKSKSLLTTLDVKAAIL